MVKNLLFLALNFVTLVWTSQEALAKKVALEWKPMEGAVLYEVQVLSEEGAVVKKTTDQTKWKTDLAFGVYTYQIRAIDEVQRPGAWSEPHPLVVMPHAPETKSPSDGAKMSFFAPIGDVLLEWKETQGAKSYKIEIKRGGKVVSQFTTTEAQLNLKGLPPGDYSWSVAAVMKRGGRSLASAPGQEWETPKSRSSDFEMKQKTLDAPSLSSPSGTLPVPENNNLTFEWGQVEGAELYEFQLTQLKLPHENQTNESVRTKKFLTKENSFTIRVPGAGNYSWGVRALASVDEKKIAQAMGPLAETGFELDKNAVYNKDLGYFALSTMLAPYSYDVVSPSRSVSASTKSTAEVVRLSGEIWFKSQWGVSAGSDFTAFQLADQTFNRKALELLLKYRAKLSLGSFGWSFSPKAGFEYRDYNFIVPGDGISRRITLNSSVYSVYGASAGLDVRRQFNDHLGIGIRASYFYPIGFASGPAQGASIQGGPSYKNISLGVQGIYWAGSNLGLGAGGFFDLRSLSYVPRGATLQEQVSMSGTYFFGSVIFRFWK